MMGGWDLEILWRNFLSLCSYNRLAAHILILCFLPDLLCLMLGILRGVRTVLAMQGLIVPYISSHDLSCSHKYNIFSHRVLPTDKNCTIVASALGHMHVAEGNG